MSNEIKVHVRYPDGRPDETIDVGAHQSVVVVGLERTVRAHTYDEKTGEAIIVIGPNEVEVARKSMTFGDMEAAGSTFGEVQG